LAQRVSTAKAVAASCFAKLKPIGDT